MRSDPVLALLAEAKKLAQQYRSLTGKPLGITGEVAEYEAARVLGIKLMPARHAGYDAIEQKDGVSVRLQIKGRCVDEKAARSQRVGAIDGTKEFDAVILVLLDANYDAFAMYEAPRSAVLAALSTPGSKARNVRKTLSIRKFKAISTIRWRSSSVEVPRSVRR